MTQWKLDNTWDYTHSANSANLQNICIYLYNLYIYFAYICCLSVCLYPINVKTAEPIGPKFCVWHHVAPGKVFECLVFFIFLQLSSLYGLYFIYTGYSRAVSLVFPMRFPWCIADMYPQSSAPLPFQPSSSIINIQLYIYSYYYSSHFHPSSLPLSSTFSLPLIFPVLSPFPIFLLSPLSCHHLTPPHIPCIIPIYIPFLISITSLYYISHSLFIFFLIPPFLAYLISFFLSYHPISTYLIPLLILSHLPFYFFIWIIFLFFSSPLSTQNFIPLKL